MNIRKILGISLLGSVGVGLVWFGISLIGIVALLKVFGICTVVVIMVAGGVRLLDDRTW